MGAVVGAVGGASVQAASSASSRVTSEVTKAATRVGVQGVSAAATDAGIQLYQTGTVDLKQTALNTAGQLVVATTAEASSARAQRTSTYAEKVNNQLIDENMAKDNLTKEQAQEMKDKFKAINEGKIKIKPGSKEGAHILDDRSNSKRGGQVAIDIGSKGEDGKRGAGRAIGTKVNGKTFYVDHTTDHDYKGCKETIKLNNPIEGLKVVNVVESLELFDDCGENEEENLTVKEKTE